MSLSIAPLLLHSTDVPTAVRVALREAYAAPESERTAHLETAARALFSQADLDCEDVRELVGLEPGTCS